MTVEKQYRQCDLTQDGQSTTAWIEQRGAKVGQRVELLSRDGLWAVVAVYDPPMSGSMLKEHQRLNRGSLPSVSRTDA